MIHLAWPQSAFLRFHKQLKLKTYRHPLAEKDPWTKALIEELKSVQSMTKYFKKNSQPSFAEVTKKKPITTWAEATKKLWDALHGNCRKHILAMHASWANALRHCHRQIYSWYTNRKINAYPRRILWSSGDEQWKNALFKVRSALGDLIRRKEDSWEPCLSKLCFILRSQIQVSLASMTSAKARPLESWSNSLKVQRNIKVQCLRRYEDPWRKALVNSSSYLRICSIRRAFPL